MRLQPTTLLAAALALAITSPIAQGQDADTPPQELDPGQVILPHNPDREIERIELEVGRDTTYFDGPLREDGTLDYIAALNEMYSEGVTLENNAFVELVLLMPVSSRSDNDSEVMAMLGLPRERVDEDACFIAWNDYALDHGVPDYERGNYYLTEDDQVTEAGQEWLDANEAALDRIVAATDRPRYWMPMIAGDGGNGNMMGVLLPQLRVLRQYSRALQARIYIQAAQGDMDGAILDLVAMRRLAVHVCHEPFLISGLVGISIDAMALQTITVLLNELDLSADNLALLADAWNDRDALIPLSDLIDHGERSMGLDLMQQLWAGRMNKNVVDLIGLGFVGARYQSRRFDVNRGLRTLNRHYNTEVRIMQIENYPEWKQQSDEWNERWKSEHAVVNQDGLGIARTLGRAVISGDGYTDLLTSLYMNMIMPALGAARGTEFRLNARAEVVWIALQCERYRLGTGEVPVTLEALVPDYLDEAPIDPMDGEPMRYIVTDTGYTVYSIGTDLEDDGGVDEYREGDIAVTIELPAD